MPPVGAGAPPPPPPPPAVKKSDSSDPLSGLAGALAGVKLKKANRQNSMSGPGDAAANGGTKSKPNSVGRSSGGGMISMMDEMQRTLARRRAKTDRGSEEPSTETNPNGDRRGSESTPSPGAGMLGGGGRSVTDSPRGASDSPRGASDSPRGTSMDVDTQKLEKAGTTGVNGLGDKVDSADLEQMKQEILREMRKEINKAKLEIIDAIRLELRK